jgi:hypothetical protein
MPHKGQRTNKHRDADFPYAVDIPIPGTGLGENLNRIVAAAAELGGEEWGHMTRAPNGDPQRWCRVGTKRPEDADLLARKFEGLGARRVR